MKSKINEEDIEYLKEIKKRNEGHSLKISPFKNIDIIPHHAFEYDPYYNCVLYNNIKRILNKAERKEYEDFVR